MEQTNHPETRRLYDDNAYLNRFTANVLACTPAKKQGRFEDFNGKFRGQFSTSR